MTEEPTLTKPEIQKPKMRTQGGGSDAVYGIGLIGAWIYYFKRATTPQERLQAFFKGLFWPAFLVFDLLTFLEK